MKKQVFRAKVTRYGVRVHGQSYWNNELINYAGQTVCCVIQRGYLKVFKDDQYLGAFRLNRK